MNCATCDDTGVVYVAGPDHFGNYDSGDCPDCTPLPPVLPPCRCAAKGQPLTEMGVMHLADCAWLSWFRSTGGCQADR